MAQPIILSASSMAQLTDAQLRERIRVLEQELDRSNFWLLVRTGDEDSCWEWQGFRDQRSGYGQWRRDTKTHRFAYEDANGPIPPGMVVCHRCDNPPCCNPKHLFAGTKRDNSEDMAAKGRSPRAKLTPRDARIIRQLAVDGARTRALATAYGVSATSIREILAGRSYREGVMPR